MSALAEVTTLKHWRFISLKMVNFYWDYINPGIGGCIIIVNLIELAVIYKIGKRIENSMVFIINLSISDLLVGIIVILSKILLDLLNKEISLKEGDLSQVNPILIEFYVFCNFGFLRLSLVNSVLNLTVITIDRFLAVGKPILYRKIQQRHALVVCAIVWLTSISIITVYYCIVKYAVFGEVKIQYDLLVFPLLALPTLIVLAVSYTSIIRILRLLRKELNVDKKNMTVSQPRQQGTRHLQREWKVIKLAIAVVTVYFICWTPLSVYGIARAFDFNSFVAEDVIFAIALLNSLLDPIVYFHHIRNEIRRAFCKLSHTIRYYFHVSHYNEEVTADILLESVA